MKKEWNDWKGCEETKRKEKCQSNCKKKKTKRKFWNQIKGTRVHFYAHSLFTIDNRKGKQKKEWMVNTLNETIIIAIVLSEVFNHFISLIRWWWWWWTHVNSNKSLNKIVHLNTQAKIKLLSNEKKLSNNDNDNENNNGIEYKIFDVSTNVTYMMVMMMKC